MEKDSQAKGQVAEAWCKDYLCAKGLKFIEQNYHSRFGEIDLIFLDCNSSPETLVFVEVRYRANSDYGTGSETVTIYKQKKLIKTAQVFLQKERKFSNYNARFDVVSISSDKNNKESFKADWQSNAFQANAW